MKELSMFVKKFVEVYAFVLFYFIRVLLILLLVAVIESCCSVYRGNLFEEGVKTRDETLMYETGIV